MTCREDAPRLKGIRHKLPKVAPEPPGPKQKSKPGRDNPLQKKSPVWGIKVVPRSKPFVLLGRKGFFLSEKWQGMTAVCPYTFKGGVKRAKSEAT